MPTSPRPILVGTDFSAPSDGAFEYVLGLAQHTRAPIHLLYVLERGADEFPFGVTGYGNDRGGVLAYVERELALRAEKATAAGLTCRTAMVEGQAPAEIIQRARDLDAGLIAVGTHGRRGLSHALLGSVAERVVRQSTCPVLTVPSSSRP